MKINIKKTLAVAALALGGSVFAANSQAALVGVNGSGGINNDGIASLGVGVTLANPGSLSVANIKSSVFGNTGDLDNVGINGITLMAGVTTLTIGAGTLTLTDFDIIGPATWGTYIASSYTIISQTASFLSIFTTGDFSPGTGVGVQAGGCNDGGNTCDTTSASLRWTFNQSGQSVTGSATFNSPAVPLVSEPADLGLLGIGLMGWAVSRRKAA